MDPRRELERLRRDIDTVDRHILGLLGDRMELVRRIGEVKGVLGAKVRDEGREAQVMANLLSHAPDALEPQEIDGIYAAILGASRTRQRKEEQRPVRLCISVLESDPDRAKTALASAAKLGDLVELRLDALDEIRLERFLPFTAGPLLVTNRGRAQGGYFRGGEAERLAHLKTAIEYGAEYVDVEWDVSPSLRSSLLESRGKSRIILSHHDPLRTPPLEEMRSLWQEMGEAGADIVKIVPFARTLSDCLIVLQFLSAVRGKRPETVAHCMGAEGRVSRVLAPLFGSCMAFAAPVGGPAAAAGQLPPGQMGLVWEILGK
jgi:3-dehydroquinate dehydratase type I